MSKENENAIWRGVAHDQNITVKQGASTSVDLKRHEQKTKIPADLGDSPTGFKLCGTRAEGPCRFGGFTDRVQALRYPCRRSLQIWGLYRQGSDSAVPVRKVRADLRASHLSSMLDYPRFESRWDPLPTTPLVYTMSSRCNLNITR
ncbi:hypothetical protein PoB_006683800 [Plakobranchus ocellatus]|uniref:Uncharacterized protein n=1 Tax=Plakobranchus ocellatus TaxID=259542 RepID=A0AAV4D7Y1_9GAST|nr:hypothetical protein PoB_006683800 [Plakobranchus ocellatus]